MCIMWTRYLCTEDNNELNFVLKYGKCIELFIVTMELIFLNVDFGWVRSMDVCKSY